MSFQKIRDNINPRKLFLVDSMGALLSAFMLGVLLVRFESVFGMPKKELYFLASIACIFFVYSLLCYLRFPKNWRPYLKAIAIANLMYCFLTMALVIYLYPQLSILGITYFVLELIIIIFLVAIELKTAYHFTDKKA